MITEKTSIYQYKHNPFQMIDQEQVESVEYCKYLGSTTKNIARCTLEIKYSPLKAIQAFNKKSLFVSKLG